MNWKDVFSVHKHELSNCHHGAVDLMITIPAITPDIVQLMQANLAKENENNRSMLIKIVSSLKYLAL